MITRSAYINIFIVNDSKHMSYIETKFRMRKRYAFLGIAVLAVFCFSDVASSQVGAFPAKEAVAIKKESPIKNPSSIKVAFIDSNFSGVDVENFSGKLEAYNIASDSSAGVTDNMVTAQGDILDKNNSHGTKVLQEFIAEYQSLQGGYAPNVLLVKISTGNDAQGKVSSVRVAKGIRYAVANGAKVINISLGTLEKTANVLTAIEDARKQSVIVVAASGNWGEDKNVAKKTMSSYAQAQGVIAVGAMEDDGDISPYTSGAGNEKLQFLAKTRFGSGTSLAVPVVAADITSILEREIDLGTDENRSGKWDIREVENALRIESADRYFSIASR